MRGDYKRRRASPGVTRSVGIQTLQYFLTPVAKIDRIFFIVSKNPSRQCCSEFAGHLTFTYVNPAFYLSRVWIRLQKNPLVSTYILTDF